MTAIVGSYEITDILTDTARTVPGRAIDPDAAEAVLAAVEGLTEIVAVDPEPVGGTVPEGQWTATDPDGRPVRVRLWADPEIDETAFGRALAAVLAEQEE